MLRHARLERDVVGIDGRVEGYLYPYLLPSAGSLLDRVLFQQMFVLCEC